MGLQGLGGLWIPRGCWRHRGRVRAVRMGHWGGGPEARVRGWVWMEELAGGSQRRLWGAGERGGCSGTAFELA